MLDLECINCEHIKGANKYKMTLEGQEGKLYTLYIYDRVPKGTAIRINPVYHNFKEIDDRLMISVKQRFTEESQPEQLEVEIIEWYHLDSGIIFKMTDTTTNEIFKIKARDPNITEEDKIVTIDLAKTGFEVKTVPHYYDRYTIENWLFIKREVAFTL